MENEFKEYEENLKSAKELRDERAELYEKIIHKRMELESLEDERQTIERKFKSAENNIKGFVEKYLTFSAKEVIAEFEKVSKKYGNKLPLITEIGLSCQIVHHNDWKDYNKKFSLIEALVYLNDKNNAYTKDHSFLYFQIKSNDNDKVKFDFINVIPLDFELKLTDGSKLYKNLYTQLETDKTVFNKNKEYFTNVMLKESAKQNVPVMLDGISYIYENKIVKEVYENLYNKSLQKVKDEEITL